MLNTDLPQRLGESSKKEVMFGKDSERSDSDNKDIIWVSSNSNSVGFFFVFFFLKLKFILDTRQV